VVPAPRYELLAFPGVLNTHLHDDKPRPLYHRRIANRGGCFLYMSKVQARCPPFKMKTLGDGCSPPNPPQPTLIKALTPALLTALNIVSKRQGLHQDHNKRTGHFRRILDGNRPESDVSVRNPYFNAPNIHWRRSAAQELNEIRTGLEIGGSR
jgi:hypothetical protein